MGKDRMSGLMKGEKAWAWSLVYSVNIISVIDEIEDNTVL